MQEGIRGGGEDYSGDNLIRIGGVCEGDKC